MRIKSHSAELTENSVRRVITSWAGLVSAPRNAGETRAEAAPRPRRRARAGPRGRSGTSGCARPNLPPGHHFHHLEEKVPRLRAPPGSNGEATSGSARGCPPQPAGTTGERGLCATGRGGPGARGAHFDGSEVTGRGLLARSSHKLPAPLTACCPPASPTLPASARNPSSPAPCAPSTSGCARSGLEVHAQGRCALHRCWALPRGTHSGAWLHLCDRPRADNAGFAVCGGFGLSGFLLCCRCGSGMR